MDHSGLDPSRLKPNLVRDGNLKPGLVTPNYAGGVPGNGTQIKPSLLDAAGQLKPGLVSGTDLKPSLLAGEAIESPPPPSGGIGFMAIGSTFIVG